MKRKRNSRIKQKKPCAECGGYGHTATFCFQRKKTVIKPSKNPMKRSRIKKIGKRTIRWIQTKEIFFATNPPDENGYYWCKIKPCKKPNVPLVAPGDPRLREVDSGVELCTVDHIIPRSKRQDLIHVQANLQEAHEICNEEKKSTVDGEYDSYGKVQRRRQTEAWLFVMSNDDLAARYLELLDLMETADDDIIIRDLQIEIDFIDKLKKERQKPLA